MNKLEREIKILQILPQLYIHFHQNDYQLHVLKSLSQHPMNGRGLPTAMMGGQMVSLSSLPYCSDIRGIFLKMKSAILVLSLTRVKELSQPLPQSE